MELFFVHDPGQTKVCNEKVRIVLRSSEQQIFRLQVSMDNPVVMEVCDGGQSRTNQVGRVSFVVGALSTDAIE